MEPSSASEKPVYAPSRNQLPFLLHDYRGPTMDKLNEALSLEAKFQPKLELPVSSQDGSEITVGIRDGSAHVLRSLKIWYELPSEVLFIAANLMDRFITKMKVRTKHMACLSIASFHLACVELFNDGSYCDERSASDTTDIQVPAPEDILTISQCRCSRDDLYRMESLISAKLGITHPGGRPVTTYVFQKIFHELLANVSTELYQKAINDYELYQRLEVIACDAACSNFRPSVVSLVLLCCQLDSVVASLRPAPSKKQVIELLTLLGDLQSHCKISERAFYSCHSTVLTILRRYDGESQLPHRQRLIWKLSQRTLRSLRPSERVVSTLATIDEHTSLCWHRRRSSSLSSEEEDWGGIGWNYPVRRRRRRRNIVNR
ncbi:hypothetical protein O3M35_000084 [Rhynocoris fuscipes]|uniref:Cyclin N-terminal domain-containing protein n=1 Tax=Rhynocoris fuscipes TaxID=488301 RepID=A0AAW1DM97_9HEMI